MIFDTHTTDDLIPAYDLPYFNKTYWEPVSGASEVDHRYQTPDYDRLPVGMERVGTHYYLSPRANMTLRFVLVAL